MTNDRRPREPQFEYVTLVPLWYRVVWLVVRPFIVPLTVLIFGLFMPRELWSGIFSLAFLLFMLRFWK